jgi:hypothetical protein
VAETILLHGVGTPATATPEEKTPQLIVETKITERR